MLFDAGEQTVLLMKNVYFIATKVAKLHTHVENLGVHSHSNWEFLQALSEENVLKDITIFQSYCG